MLLELTPAEVAFLTASHAVTDSLQARLTRKLAATLTARLRLPVLATAQALGPVAEASGAPVWQPDAALATLWLTRRLGGRQVMGAASFVPHTLIHALNTALAECWLDAPAQTALPTALAWQLACGAGQASLAVQLPHHITDMTRWAREIIRHG